MTAVFSSAVFAMPAMAPMRPSPVMVPRVRALPAHGSPAAGPMLAVAVAVLACARSPRGGRSMTVVAGRPDVSESTPRGTSATPLMLGLAWPQSIDLALVSG
jgi:hypothetical protein